MIQRKRKTKRFYRLLLSYCLIVVLITVIVYTGIISRYLNSVQKNTETEYNRMAENAGNLLDERISELSALAARINGNKRLRNSVIQNSYFAQMEAIDELSNYNNLNSFLTDVLLFMFPEETENVLVLTSLNKYTLTSFFQTHQFDNWTPEEIEELYRSNQQLSSQLPIMKFVRERNSVSGAWDVDLCCLYILPIGFANPREIAAFRISEEKLISLVESATGGNRVVFSIQENNAVIYSSSSESTENAYEHTVPSSVVNWSYTVRFLDAPLMEAVGWVRMQMGLIMICLLTVSVLLAVFFTYINHLPLRMLADKLNSDRTGVDEIQILDEGMDDLLKTRDEMQLQLNKKDRALRAKRLTSLLLGNEDDMKLFFPDGL